MRNPQKPIGLLFLLDEESNFPKGSDATCLAKFHSQYEKHSFYVKPKTQAPVFGVKHYAGEVTYQMNGFLDKNKDTIRQDLTEILTVSTNKIVVEVFKEVSMEEMAEAAIAKAGKAGTVKPGAAGGTLRKGSKSPTVGAQFHVSSVFIPTKISFLRSLFFLGLCVLHQENLSSINIPILFGLDDITDETKMTRLHYAISLILWVLVIRFS